LRERARAIGAEFATIKAQNRRAHRLSDDGTPPAQAAARRLSQVVLAIDKGDVQVPGMSAIEGRVFI